MKRTVHGFKVIFRFTAMVAMCVCLMAANDCDGDGFTPPFDCNDSDASIHPLAVEAGDWADSNCNGYEDVSIGFTRETAALKGGTATAVEYYGDFVYVSASSWLKVYYAPPGSIPLLVGQLELREMVREMHVSGNTLFVANRGDGLIAIDISTPSNPQERGRVSGYFEAPGVTDPVAAVFNGVDAIFDGSTHTVAVTLMNDLFTQGTVDVAIFSYDPQCNPPTEECFTILNAFESQFLRNNEIGLPVVVGLTRDGVGMFVGYSSLDMVYAEIDGGSPPLQIDYAGVFDIAMLGNDAYVASGLTDSTIKLSRLRVQNNTLVRDGIHNFDIAGPGAAVDISGDTLCFGIAGPDRDPQGSNLYVFDGISGGALPTLSASEGTQDWIFQLACRETGSGTGWVYVADEWAGLQFWERNQTELVRPYDDTHYPSNHPLYPLNYMRIPTGMFATNMWVDKSGNLPRVFSAKEGAAVWYFDFDAAGNPINEGVAVEYIGANDPGCNENCVCSQYMGQYCDCCPPEQGVLPYPPAVFVADVTANMGRLAMVGHNRNTAIAGEPYFMIFEQAPDQSFTCIYGEALSGTDGRIIHYVPVNDEESLLFLSAEVDQPDSSVNHLRIYQHCTGGDGEDDLVRLLTVAEIPARAPSFWLGDIAVKDEYLFVTEVEWAWVEVFPHDGQVHAVKWRDQQIPSCSQPVPSFTPVHLGFFGGPFNPYSLLLDETGDTLFVGTSRGASPNQNVAVLAYEGLSACYLNPSMCFDDPATGIDLMRTAINLEGSINRNGDTLPDVRGMVLDGDTLHFVDYFNGLYSYSLSSQSYDRFYPAHRPDFHAALRPELMLAPLGTYPLYNPLAIEQVDIAGQKMLLVQEHTTGKVAILTEN